MAVNVGERSRAPSEDRSEVELSVFGAFADGDRHTVAEHAAFVSPVPLMDVPSNHIAGKEKELTERCVSRQERATSDTTSMMTAHCARGVLSSEIRPETGLLQFRNSPQLRPVSAPIPIEVREGFFSPHRMSVTHFIEQEWDIFVRSMSEAMKSTREYVCNKGLASCFAERVQVYIDSCEDASIAHSATLLLADLNDMEASFGAFADTILREQTYPGGDSFMGSSLVKYVEGIPLTTSLTNMRELTELRERLALLLSPVGLMIGQLLEVPKKLSSGLGPQLGKFTEETDELIKKLKTLLGSIDTLIETPSTMPNQEYYVRSGFKATDGAMKNQEDVSSDEGSISSDEEDGTFALLTHFGGMSLASEPARPVPEPITGTRAKEFSELFESISVGAGGAGAVTQKTDEMSRRVESRHSLGGIEAHSAWTAAQGRSLAFTAESGRPLIPTIDEVEGRRGKGSASVSTQQHTDHALAAEKSRADEEKTVESKAVVSEASEDELFFGEMEGLE